ncbi:MAG: DUF3048 domain-containing protein [Clostridia bacterium]|jgi:hypothetical protein|nr:DUF3048 domain-containing protein [Clostridia bacterium]MDD4145784.1 DUF3048 domain-containing protein [Clostridia bacterium]MDD4665096.1 DUF3048 domain-containing protein [Clostridia bacterium]
MKKKYVLWGFLVFLLSIVVGAMTFCLVRPYFLGEKALYSERKDNDKTMKEEDTYFFAGWQDKPRQRALAVIIDNAEKARPQAGLERADVIVEFPVEGGLTRFLAIICNDDMDLIGPIRSARPYFIDLANEYKGILIHAGGSAEALKILQKESTDHLDEINGGVLIASAFWRIPARLKPHNLFTSSDVLRHTVKKLNVNFSSLPPQRPLLPFGAEVAGKKAEELIIFYAHKSSLARFSFDEEKGVFRRFTTDNKPHLTSLGEQLQAANVIVQVVPYCYTDGDGHLQLIMHGEGEALIFRKGKVLQGCWKKMPGEFTMFTDQKGKQVPLLEGPTWIAVVPRGTRIDY